VNTVLSEAGPRIAGALVAAGLADRLMLITAPVAGGDGPPALDGIGKTVDLKALRVRRLGADVALEGDL
jgi:diaminohydroxyphosphoribosylaminopyrimidine deaminase/5-amino-6-(5-phosphoribosylamino)uracil reductase